MRSALLATASLVTGAAALLDCSVDAFNALLPSNTTTEFAVSVPENGTFGEDGDVAYPKVAAGLPALCAVAFNVNSSPTSSFRFGMFLPEQWNNRLFTSGNGGFWGGINWIDMAQGPHYGAASVSTDTGHNVSSSNDATWAFEAPERINDWAGRAMHESVVQAKSIARAYYDDEIRYSYYSGCSTGGYQGLKEVQTHEDDFDGVLVGSPAWWHSHLQTWSIQAGIWNQPAIADYHIPDSLFSTIETEVMRQCDGADGVVDNIISAPGKCAFNPETLLCTPQSNASQCLTSPQIDLLYKIYNDWVGPDNTLLFPQYTYGSEFSWSLLANGTAEDSFSAQYFRYLILQNLDWTVSNFSYQTVLDAERIGAAYGLDADGFDLTPFQSRNGKLLHYAGMGDGLIPPGSSEYFYKHVVRSMAPSGVQVDDFYRLFLIPGMGHCSKTSSATTAPWYINGAGQASNLDVSIHGVPGYQDADHDAVLALIRWVESDQAPTHLVATKFANDSVPQGVLQQRPVCAYPDTATFNGGDLTNADNWSCADGSQS